MQLMKIYQRLIQGIIPDMVIDARGRINSGASPVPG
jgi:hypothetical protein